MLFHQINSRNHKIQPNLFYIANSIKPNSIKNTVSNSPNIKHASQEKVRVILTRTTWYFSHLWPINMRGMTISRKYLLQTLGSQSEHATNTAITLLYYKDSLTPYVSELNFVWSKCLLSSDKKLFKCLKCKQTYFSKG